MAFRPGVGDKILINSEKFNFAEHPAAKGMPYGQTGRRATVYRITNSEKTSSALKVFTLAFRKEQIAKNARKLNQISRIAGLHAAARYVIQEKRDAELIAAEPDLRYAVLMPWMDGMTWQEMMLNQHHLLPFESLRLAKRLSSILAELESKGIAHCDLSGPNIMVEVAKANEVSLVDLEDLFAEGLLEPVRKPAGSDGYAHLVAKHGLWGPQADRFSGAILFAEMLGWCDERVRQAAYGEQYFSLQEMQTVSKRYALLQDAIKKQWGQKISLLLDKAWSSKKLSACPSLLVWHEAIAQAQEEFLTQAVRQLKQHVAAGELEQANQHASAIYMLAPQQVAKLWIPVLLSLGDAALAKRRWAQAIRYFEQGTSLSPAGPLEYELELKLKKARAGLRRRRARARKLRQEQQTWSDEPVMSDSSLWAALSFMIIALLIALLAS